MIVIFEFLLFVHRFNTMIMQDGLSLITNHPELVCGYPLAILTPNRNEHKNLVAKMMSGPNNWQDVPDNDMEGQLRDLAKQ